MSDAFDNLAAQKALINAHISAAGPWIELVKPSRLGKLWWLDPFYLWRQRKFKRSFVTGLDLDIDLSKSLMTTSCYDIELHELQQQVKAGTISDHAAAFKAVLLKQK